VNPTVGLVGLGRMGGPMARNLLRAGLELVVHDIDSTRCAETQRHGAHVARSPREVSASSDISLSIIMDDRVLRAVALGPDGILTGARPGHLYCDLSTVSPDASREVAQQAAAAAVHYLRAKVAGSVALAERGELTVFASGDRADFETAEPVLACVGREVRYVGEDEAAHFLKLAHSVVVGVYAALVGEAVTFARGGGVDYDTVIDVLAGGPLASEQLTLKAPLLKSREFGHPPSDVNTAAKDLDLVLLAARGARVPMPLTAAVLQLMTAQQARGEGASDIWSVIRAFEAMADIGDT